MISAYHLLASVNSVMILFVFRSKYIKTQFVNFVITPLNTFKWLLLSSDANSVEILFSCRQSELVRWVQDPKETSLREADHKTKDSRYFSVNMFESIILPWNRSNAASQLWQMLTNIMFEPNCQVNVFYYWQRLSSFRWQKVVVSSDEESPVVCKKKSVTVMSGRDTLQKDVEDEDDDFIGELLSSQFAVLDILSISSSILPSTAFTETSRVQLFICTRDFPVSQYISVCICSHLAII